MSLIAVCSGKGSPGATVCAINLAAAYTRAGAEVLLIDCDPAGGDVAAYLGLDLRRGLHVFISASGGPIDPVLLRAEADRRHGFGAIRGFSGPFPPPATPVVSEILAAARTSAAVVICDLGRIDPTLAPAAAEADVAVVVVRPTLPSVDSTLSTVNILEWAGLARARIRVVLSGAQRRNDQSEVAHALGFDISGVLRRDDGALLRSMRAQAPLRAGAIARDNAALARALTADLPPPEAAVYRLHRAVSS